MFIIDTESKFQQYTNLAQEHPEKFWAEVAHEFEWKKTWNQVCKADWQDVNMRWYDGAQLNITENCLDRHLKDKADQVAFYWEPNDPQQQAKTYTYAELHADVCRYANALRQLGVKKGDRVCLYLPMIPSLAIAVLACARIGAIHSVVFAGFSAQALADRIQDAACSVLITSDLLYRGNKVLALLDIAQEAAEQCPSLNHVLVHQLGEDLNLSKPLYTAIDSLVAASDTWAEAEVMEAEDPLFILYTSGSTGKPKGVVHTCGGYMVYAGYSFAQVFQYRPGDVFWCTADIGWITGHSYIVYGPLLNGAQSVMFEGVPTYPEANRFWKVVEKYKVNQFYTAPTAIRALMACGDEWLEGVDLSSLKVLGTVGEPINEEAWRWYKEKIGGGTCPIVDTWWQTETGGIMLSALGEVGPQIPAHAGRPLPGIIPCLMSAEGEEIEANEKEGLLCIKAPWPSMIRSTWGDHERCKQTYFSAFSGKYFTGDGAKRDAHGNYRVIGRVDDVINVSGHRFGTAEIEEAINQHPKVVESAVVGVPHEVKGQGIYAFVIASAQGVEQEIIQLVEQSIGKIARPDTIQLCQGLPKTRSGKIMRRILRKIATQETENLGDTSTLLDPQVVDDLIAGRA